MMFWSSSRRHTYFLVSLFKAMAKSHFLFQCGRFNNSNNSSFYVGEVVVLVSTWGIARSHIYSTRAYHGNVLYVYLLLWRMNVISNYLLPGGLNTLQCTLYNVQYILVAKRGEGT